MSNPDSETLPVGYQIAGLQVVRFLGKGGFAQTYLCENINQHNSLCVLKELYPMEIVQRGSHWEVVRNQDDYANDVWNAAVKNFNDEVLALKSLNVKNIPRFLDVFTANNSYYLVQEFIEGMSLYDYQEIAGNSADVVNNTIQLLKDLLLILRKIHKNGILHRDIKPDNIIIRQSDNEPVLIDFGGVRFQVGGVTFNFDRRVGAVGYSSPEQISETAEQSQSSDLYALAATFYFLLFGQEPVDSSDRLLGESEMDFMVLADDWPHYFLESLQKAYLLSSKARYQTADEWLLDLESVEDIAQPINIWRIGRDPEQVDVLLTECSNTVSRLHLEIHLYDNGIEVVDFSSNGVIVGFQNLGRETYAIDRKKIKINGRQFFSKEQSDFETMELDLAGNIYKLTGLIDLPENY